MRPRSLLVLAGAAVAFALAATGCGVSTGTAGDRVVVGASGSGQATATWLSQATAQTAEVTSQRVMVESIISTNDGGVVLETRAEGSFDAATGRGQVTVEVQSDSAGLADQLGSIEVVIDGDDLYLKSPMNELLGGDAPWLALRSDQLGDFATSGDLSQTSRSTLDLLERSGSEMTTLGTEEVRGVSTTHLATQLDVSALLAEASPDRAEELRDTLSDLAVDLGPEMADIAPIEAEIWVDDQDFIRRVQLTIDGSSLPSRLGSGGFSSVQTIELFDFNEPVDITIPDPSEISQVDPSDLFGN